jgi:hypothetical protein
MVVQLRPEWHRENPTERAMGKLSQIVAILCPGLSFIIVALSGCTAIQQQILAAARQPGERIETTPDRVWQELGCAKRERPFVRIETMEILPEMIKPGGRVNYRLVYAMCPYKPTEVVKSRVIRKMLFNGEQVARNVKDGFELKPGRWVVDSFFTLPRESPLGVYALEVGLETTNGCESRVLSQRPIGLTVSS